MNRRSLLLVAAFSVSASLLAAHSALAAAPASTKVNTSIPFDYKSAIIGQSFKTVEGGTLKSITIKLTGERFNGGGYVLELYQSAPDELNGKSPVVTSNPHGINVNADNEVMFPAGVTLQPGTEYTFVIHANGTNFFVLAGANDNAYADGKLVRSKGALKPAAGFSSDAAVDLYFTVNMTNLTPAQAYEPLYAGCYKGIALTGVSKMAEMGPVDRMSCNNQVAAMNAPFGYWNADTAVCLVSSANAITAASSKQPDATCPMTWTHGGGTGLMVVFKK